jgi:hypothetical protein
MTLAVYLAATAATALSWNFLSFALLRAATGAGIGGESSAIASTIQELIPARTPPNTIARRPGPVGACSDAELAEHIRQHIAAFTARATASYGRGCAPLSSTLANFGSARETGLCRASVSGREFYHCLGLAVTVQKLTRPIFCASNDR